jgi:hypothetical protein
MKKIRPGDPVHSHAQALCGMDNGMEKGILITVLFPAKEVSRDGRNEKPGSSTKA